MKKFLKNLIKDSVGYLYYNTYLKYFPVIGNRALIYHAFGSSLKHDTYGISINIKDFENQIKFYKSNYDIINIIDYAKLSINTLSITIDDGYKDNLYAIDILNKYNIPFTLYITTNNINSENYLSEDDIKEISMLKIAKIGSHCCNHLRLNLLTNEQIYSELKDSKKVLENIVGGHVENISYPHGGYNKYVLDILPSLGYKYAASSIKGKNNSKTNRYLLNRIEIIKSDSIKKIVNKINGYYDYY